MKRILLVMLILLFGGVKASAIEELPEVQLDVEEEKLNFDGSVEQNENKVYFDENDPLRLHMEGHLIDELKIGAVYNGTFNLNFVTHPTDTHLEYDIPYLDTWVEGKFKNDKTSFKVNVNPIRYVPKRNYMASLWQDFWVKHDFNEHQSVTVGYYRTPNGQEGSISAYVQDFSARSQIARTFANARATGVKNSGRYKYFDYDIGVFDSARYFDTFLQGFEFIAKGTVKPLEFADGKYGHLNIMGSINNGRRNSDNYMVVNAYIGYKYKKFSIEGEYAHANGYNGPVNHSTNRAQGFYATVKYELHPKLDILVRYDLFDPNMAKSGNNIEEYSVGLNYYPFKRVVIMLNYVFRQDHLKGKSNAIVLVTQFQI